MAFLFFGEKERQGGKFLARKRRRGERSERRKERKERKGRGGKKKVYVNVMDKIFYRTSKEYESISP